MNLLWLLIVSTPLCTQKWCQAIINIIKISNAKIIQNIQNTRTSKFQFESILIVLQIWECCQHGKRPRAVRWSVIQRAPNDTLIKPYWGDCAGNEISHSDASDVPNFRTLTLVKIHNKNDTQIQRFSKSKSDLSRSLNSNSTSDSGSRFKWNFESHTWIQKNLSDFKIESGSDLNLNS